MKNKDKALIITGASRGIGHAIANFFLQQSYSVINISRTPHPNSSVTNILADLSSLSSLEELKDKISHISNNFNSICLIHNAWSYQSDQIQNINMDHLKSSFTIGLVAPIRLNQILIPLMKELSSIIYIGSTLSEKSVPHAASYSCLKHGVVGLMRASCQDLLDNSKIHTACVCPGFTKTQMLLQHLKENDFLEEVKTRVSKKRLVEPDEIASLCFHISQNPSLNGSVLHANLGQKEY